MKIKGLLVYSIGVFLTLSQFSCNKLIEDKDGDWDDNIKLSTRLVNFTGTQNIVEIKTQNTWWWINSVNTNNEYFMPKYQTNMFDKENIIVNTDWLTVERKDGKTIELTATNNTTQSKRTATISLQAGNYFDYITVIQSNQ